jgi:hypothetical protein
MYLTVIARHEAIPDRQVRPVQFAIASYLAMTAFEKQLFILLLLLLLSSCQPKTAN